MSGSIVFRQKSMFFILFLYLLATLLFNFSVSSQPNSVMINEFLASNQKSLADGDGDLEDWIELYNPTSKPIHLEGYTITDSPKNTTKWTYRTLQLILRDFCFSGLPERTAGLLVTGTSKAP